MLATIDTYATSCSTTHAATLDIYASRCITTDADDMVVFLVPHSIKKKTQIRMVKVYGRGHRDTVEREIYIDNTKVQGPFTILKKMNVNGIDNILQLQSKRIQKNIVAMFPRAHGYCTCD